MLGKVVRQAEANAGVEPKDSAEARRARVIGALLNGLLGRNFMDTEEPGAAQPKLEAAIEVLEGSPEEAVALVDALNSLGVLWANRGEAQRSLELLERAQKAHAAARADGANLEAKQRLEDQYTLTTFYLAQAYGLLGRRAESAAHCHETMKRQLARRGMSGGGEFAYDAREWARNACDLSKYYCSVERYDVAEHCLRAAESMLTSARRRTPLPASRPPPPTARPSTSRMVAGVWRLAARR